MIQFYKMLRYITGVRQDEESKSKHKFHKKYLSKIKGLFIVMYLLVNPLLQTP